MRVLLLLLCFWFDVGLQAQTISAVLSRMDEAAPKFHGMSASVRMTTHTAIIDDTEVENGKLEMQRQKGQDVRAILNFSAEKDSRVIGFFGRTVRIYYPKLQSFQDYDLGKSTDVLNQFLLLGFGSSGKDLATSYDISSEGQERIGNRETTKLVLIPKNKDVANRLSRVEIWVPNDAAYPIQQKFIEPSDNYRVVTYSSVDLNPSLGKLEIKVPSGAKKPSP